MISKNIQLGPVNGTRLAIANLWREFVTTKNALSPKPIGKEPTMKNQKRSITSLFILTGALIFIVCGSVSADEYIFHVSSPQSQPPTCHSAYSSYYYPPVYRTSSVHHYYRPVTVVRSAPIVRRVRYTPRTVHHRYYNYTPVQRHSHCNQPRSSSYGFTYKAKNWSLTLR